MQICIIEENFRQMTGHEALDLTIIESQFAPTIHRIRYIEDVERIERAKAR
jgi:hypothetical protein